MKNLLGNKTSQKLISILIIISVMLPFFAFSKPKKAEAFVTGWVSDFFAPLTSASTATTAIGQTTQVVLTIKEVAKRVLQEILKNLAKRFLQQMTKSTVNWINSGFHGSPLFLENPQSFFKDIAKYETQTFIDQIGYNSLKYPFGRNIALNTIASYRNQFETNAQYTLSRVIDDPTLLNNFRTDFSVGGWNGFLLNTQYPQNNYLGFQMMATDELARRLQGTYQSKAQQIQTTLAQGQGFLSPKMCPSNPRYNNLVNEFQQPKFNASKAVPYTPPKREAYNSDDEWGNAMLSYEASYQNAVADEKARWDFDHSCPGGLINTTPGSVVANQINTAMGSQFRQSELAAAMGNSISAVLDALLNHFMDKGLNALASKANPPPPTDDWDYLGNTLGTVNSYGSSTWDMGPDEVIVLSEFKREVAQGITNTTIEITLLDNLAKMHNQIWPRAQELDRCIPGPDRNWEDRLNEEKDINAAKLQEKSSDDDPNEAARAREAFRQLNYAVKFFTDWIKNKMIDSSNMALPNSVLFIEAVNDLDAVYQESEELVNRKRTKNQTLARLRAIEGGLAAFTTDPAPGSAGEKTLIDLRKQYNATRYLISSSDTIGDTQNDFNSAEDKFDGLRTMLTQCLSERTAKGWAPPDNTGKGLSRGVDKNGKTGTEKELFCSFPIVGGFSHGERIGTRGIIEEIFRNPVKPPQYGDEVPMVNADKVFKYDKAFGSGYVSIRIKCDPVFKAHILDYKGSIPGITGPLGEIPAPDAGDPGGGGGSSSGGNTGPNQASLEGDLHAQRGGYPASFSSLCPNGAGLQPTSCPLGYILNAVAWQNKDIGWGLLRKTSGHRCPSPAGEIACDILYHKPSDVHYDVFVDSEGKADVTWNNVGLYGNVSKWVAPAQP